MWLSPPAKVGIVKLSCASMDAQNSTAGCPSQFSALGPSQGIQQGCNHWSSLAECCLCICVFLHMCKIQFLFGEQHCCSFSKIATNGTLGTNVDYRSVNMPMRSKHCWLDTSRLIVLMCLSECVKRLKDSPQCMYIFLFARYRIKIIVCAA